MKFKRARDGAPEQRLSTISRPARGRIDRTDGLKLVFDDGSWILLRLSGTEPLLRVLRGSRDASGVSENCRRRARMDLLTEPQARGTVTMRRDRTAATFWRRIRAHDSWSARFCAHHSRHLRHARIPGHAPHASRTSNRYSAEIDRLESEKISACRRSDLAEDRSRARSRESRAKRWAWRDPANMIFKLPPDVGESAQAPRRIRIRARTERAVTSLLPTAAFL